MEKWQDRGDYLFRSEWDSDMKVDRDIYLYKKPQKREIKNKIIVFNRLEIESTVGFDNDEYRYAFYYLDSELVASE